MAFRYFGHGGGEQYVRSHKIRHLPRCAATMLWGCSSGSLKEMGEFDRVGTPFNYMLAGWYVASPFCLHSLLNIYRAQPFTSGEPLGRN
jgi:hypothetical protein